MGSGEIFKSLLLCLQDLACRYVLGRRNVANPLGKAAGDQVSSMSKTRSVIHSHPPSHNIRDRMLSQDLATLGQARLQLPQQGSAMVTLGKATQATHG